MSFLNDCFNTMLEYGEAVKSSFVKGHVSDWPEKKEEEETVIPEEPKTEESEIVGPEVTEPTDPIPGVTEEPKEEEGEF